MLAPITISVRLTTLAARLRNSDSVLTGASTSHLLLVLGLETVNWPLLQDQFRLLRSSDCQPRTVYQACAKFLISKSMIQRIKAHLLAKHLQSGQGLLIYQPNPVINLSVPDFSAVFSFVLIEAGPRLWFCHRRFW